MADPRWSGLRNTFIVEYEDGSKSEPIRTGMSEFVKFERKFKRTYFDLSELKVEELLWTVWMAGRRSGAITTTLFDDWIGTVADYATLDADDDDEGAGSDVDPTPTDRSDD